MREQASTPTPVARASSSTANLAAQRSRNAGQRRQPRRGSRRAARSRGERYRLALGVRLPSIWSKSP